MLHSEEAGRMTWNWPGLFSSAIGRSGVQCARSGRQAHLLKTMLESTTNISLSTRSRSIATVTVNDPELFIPLIAIHDAKIQPCGFCGYQIPAETAATCLAIAYKKHLL